MPRIREKVFEVTIVTLKGRYQCSVYTRPEIEGFDLTRDLPKLKGRITEIFTDAGLELEGDTWVVPQ